MTTDELLMEIQDTDELLYTQEEAELMLDYLEATKEWEAKDDEEEALRLELVEKFGQLNSLITEYNDRIALTSDNATEPTKDEIAALKRLFDQIEKLDFETSDKYKFMTGSKM
ncbi:MAG: hypothetical protein MJZ24_08545 [Paludibacteraceae bacterium]|nr:hypothetical protein [Candidatus Physcocola equi]MCQ2234767.1 hypothetical protein [Paludibacteraceae bacterium]